MAAFIEVVGNGVATAPPDRLDLFLGVTAVRPDVGSALAHLGTRVTALGTALRSVLGPVLGGAGAGFADADLQTTGSNVGEEYAEGRPVGYRATQDLRVRLSDPDTVSAVLGAALDAVGDDLRLNHLSWAIADESALAEQARTAAFEDARSKAEQLARLAGGTLGPVLELSEGTSPGGPVVRLAAAKADAGFAVERGECRVEVSVTAKFSL